MKFNEDSEKIMKLLLPLYEKKIKKGINNSKMTKSRMKTYTSSLKQMFNNIRTSHKNIEHLKKSKGFYEHYLEEMIEKINEKAKIFVFYSEGTDFEINYINNDKSFILWNGVKIPYFKYKIRNSLMILCTFILFKLYTYILQLNNL